jgi:hypothetical protein
MVYLVEGYYTVRGFGRGALIPHAISAGHEALAQAFQEILGQMVAKLLK